jgi:hypothetical protein
MEADKEIEISMRGDDEEDEQVIFCLCHKPVEKMLIY